MDARFSRILLVAVLLAVATGASYQTANFVIETDDPGRAELYGQTAERFRRDLAIEWFGEEMPRWADRCRVTVQVGPRLGAGGATTFVFDKGQVFGWRMSIQGSHERILDSVLPHEIMHMVLASQFRRPLPRWADEGAATSVEHLAERMRHRKMLVEFLQTQRGIPFNHMFAMKEYPRDIMPLYAQGFALAEYLIQQGGKRKFMAFVGDGMQNEQWSQAAKKHYGHENLGTLQNAWLAWVAQGFPQIETPVSPPADRADPPMIAASRLPRPEPNLVYHDVGETGVTPAGYTSPAHQAALPPQAEAPPPTGHPANEWQPSGGPETMQASERPAHPPESGPTRAHVSHPTPPQKPRQIILQWQRR